MFPDSAVYFIQHYFLPLKLFSTNINIILCIEINRKSNIIKKYKTIINQIHQAAANI